MWAPGSAEQRDRGWKGELRPCWDRGLPEADMCHRAGMPRGNEWIDVCVGGQAGLLAGSIAERAEPLEGLAGLRRLRLPRTLDKAFPASALE